MTRSGSSTDTLVQGASPIKVISPERALVLSPIFDGDKYEVQIVQLETIRLNGLNSVEMLKSLLGLVNKLSEVTQLKSDNASLKAQLNTLPKSVEDKSKISEHSTAGSLPPQSTVNAVARKPVASATAALSGLSIPADSTSADMRVLSYKEVTSKGLSPQVATPADSEGFVTVTNKRKNTVAPMVKNIKSRRQPIGVRNSTSLLLQKKERIKAIFVSRFCPDMTTDDAVTSLKEQLSLKKLVCTRLKTKFSTYASFHVSILEDEFPLINNTGVWPAGCLIAPFLWQTHSGHMFHQ
jgi:hypothetical protein